MWEKMRGGIKEGNGKNTATVGSDWFSSFQEARMGSFIDQDISLSVSVKCPIKWKIALFSSWPQGPVLPWQRFWLFVSSSVSPYCLLFAFHSFFPPNFKPKFYLSSVRGSLVLTIKFVIGGCMCGLCADIHMSPKCCDRHQMPIPKMQIINSNRPTQCLFLFCFF